MWDVIQTLALAGERNPDLTSPGDLSIWRGQMLVSLCFEGQNCLWSPPRLPEQLPQGLKEAETVTALQEKNHCSVREKTQQNHNKILVAFPRQAGQGKCKIGQPEGCSLWESRGLFPEGIPRAVPCGNPAGSSLWESRGLFPLGIPWAHPSENPVSHIKHFTACS